MVNGPAMYRNFLFNIAGLKGDWTMAAFRQEMVQKIRDQVGDGKVICGLSGGVDSSVAAVLIDRVQILMARRRLPFFYLQVAGGAIATLLAAGVAATPIDVDPSLVVTANIILLLAGIGLMGAVQDALTFARESDYPDQLAAFDDVFVDRLPIPEYLTN